jgi:hypothetical protein
VRRNASLAYAFRAKGIGAYTVIRQKSPVGKAVETGIVNRSHTGDCSYEKVDDKRVLQVMNMTDIGFVLIDYLSDGVDCLFCEKRTPNMVINPKFKILAWIFQSLASRFLVGMIIVHDDI